MTPSTPALRVHDLYKAFGATQAVKGASFELRRGERLALLGPNGAGKTTIIRCIAGRAIPDSGSIELLGETLPRRGARPGLGVVPQEIAIYPRLTAKENMEIFARLHGAPADEVAERVEWALEWTGLEERANEPTKNFSGGMKRRVNIACAVLHHPRVLLLDEPTVGVDPQSRELIYDMLDNLRKHGASIVLATHHLDEAEVRCDRIVVVDHGKVVDSGTLGELVGRTVGHARRVSITPAELPESFDGLTIDRARGVMTAQLTNLSADLPALLTRLEASSVVVHDVEVRHPSLQAVFLHLTGRDLRE
jgi:ABC-2 type transport system ATP-binding protein